MKIRRMMIMQISIIKVIRGWPPLYIWSIWLTGIQFRSCCCQPMHNDVHQGLPAYCNIHEHSLAARLQRESAPHNWHTPNLKKTWKNNLYDRPKSNSLQASWGFDPCHINFPTHSYCMKRWCCGENKEHVPVRNINSVHWLGNLGDCNFLMQESMCMRSTSQAEFAKLWKTFR